MQSVGLCNVSANVEQSLVRELLPKFAEKGYSIIILAKVP